MAHEDGHRGSNAKNVFVAVLGEEFIDRQSAAGQARVAIVVHGNNAAGNDARRNELQASFNGIIKVAVK